MRAALIYDFDHTLSEEYQQFPILRQFWPAIQEKYREFNFHGPEEYFARLCSGQGIEVGVGAMQQILLDARDIFIDHSNTEMPGLSTEKMRTVYGPEIKLAPGIPAWFQRINEYAASLDDFALEHHVISAGCAPLIAGTAIMPYLHSLRSGTFIDDGERITKIKTIVDPNNKREEIIKLCKGQGLHEDIPFDNYHINYENVIVVGDGHSDKRKFNFIRERGGIAIGVYEKGSKEARERAEQQLQGRVHYLLPRDYSAGKPLEEKVQQSLSAMAARTCSFDYRLIHALQRNHLKDQSLIALASQHMDSCGDCRERSRGMEMAE